MTETIPTSCPDLMNPQTFRRLKKAGPHFTEVGEDGQQNLTARGISGAAGATASSPVWTHLLHSPILLVCLYLYFPQHHRYPSALSFKTATLFTKASETQGTAKQQSHRPPSNELNNPKVSSAPKSSKQTESSQLLSSSVVWSSGPWAGLTTSLTVTNQQAHTMKSTISPPARDPGFQLSVCCSCIRLKCTRFLKKQKGKKKPDFTNKLSKLSPRKGHSNF